MVDLHSDVLEPPYSYMSTVVFDKTHFPKIKTEMNSPNYSGIQNNVSDMKVVFYCEKCRKHLLDINNGYFLWKNANIFIQVKAFSRHKDHIQNLSGSIEIIIKKNSPL